MKTYVITGGTDGIGKGIAIDALEKGNVVINIGRNRQKGMDFLKHAEGIGAGSRAVFLQADLSLVRENRRVLAEIGSRFPKIDVLVLCAQHGRSVRDETDEGYEHTFALYYLSRFLFSYGLKTQLNHADQPVIVNVCAPGVEAGQIHWDDLQLTSHYASMNTALMQGSRLNDLLGVAFADNNKDLGIRYVLFNPGGVSTSFSGDYDSGTKQMIEQFKKLAKPVSEGIQPIVHLIEQPPGTAISAYIEGKELSLAHESFDPSKAERLFRLTSSLLRNSSGYVGI